MLKLSYFRLLAFISFMLCIGLLASCDKEDDSLSGVTQLLSFGPTGAKHGDTLRFIGTGLNKVTAIQFTGTNAVIDQSDFKQQTPELILVIVPQAAEEGFVTLKTADAELVTKTRLNLNVKTNFAMTSMTAEARPGENITISGKYLNWVKRVTFPRGKVVQTFVSKSMNSLVVTVPADAETGPLIITYAGTDTADVETSTPLKVTLPVITAMAPNPVKHQTNLTITGTNLDLAKKVWFEGVSDAVTAFVSQSATQLVVKVPAATKKGKVTLEAASGVKTQSTGDLDVQLPAITSVTPSPVDPGANVTIKGTNLDLVSGITFANAPAVVSFVSQSATQIVAKVPSGVLRGKVTFAVLNSTLTVQSPDVLEITGDVPPPTIAFPIYNDAVTSNWSGWVGDGWGGTKDYNNAAPVREGSKSVKIVYSGGYGSPMQLGGANVNTGSYTTLKLSIYGGAGSNGKNVNLGINGKDAQTITLVEGKWTDYSFPISSLTTDGKITEIILKEYNGSGGFTVYVDALGLN